MLECDLEQLRMIISTKRIGLPKSHIKEGIPRDLVNHTHPNSHQQMSILTRFFGSCHSSHGHPIPSGGHSFHRHLIGWIRHQTRCCVIHISRRYHHRSRIVCSVTSTLVSVSQKYRYSVVICKTWRLCWFSPLNEHLVCCAEGWWNVKHGDRARNCT